MTIDVDKKLNKKLTKTKSSKAKLMKLLKSQELAKSESGFLTANTKKAFFLLK